MAAAGGLGLVEEGVLPGRQRMHRALGGCGSKAPVPDVEPGAVVSGIVHVDGAVGDRRRVERRLSAGVDDHAALPVCVALHGRGSNHAWAFDTLSLQYVLADAVDRGHVARRSPSPRSTAETRRTGTVGPTATTRRP